MHITVKKVGPTYLIETNEKDIKYNGKIYRRVEKAQFVEAPYEIKRIYSSRRITEYVPFDEESDTLLAFQYDMHIKKLLEGSTYNRNDERVFPNIDAEYKYKKFIESYKPVFEEYEKEEDITFHVVEIIGRTDVHGITPFRLIGEDPVKDDEILYEYQADPVYIARIIADKYGFEEVSDTRKDATKGMKWNTSHKDLEFMKINEEYVGTEFRGVGKGFYDIYAGTFDECYARYSKHYDMIDAVFARAKRLFEAEGETLNRADVVRSLEKIRDVVNKIDSKVRTQGDHQAAKKQISDLIKRLMME